MYCGSCLRDNRVAATLIEQGRDVVLQPLYTPLRTDETTVSRRHVYYAGIDVYLRHMSAIWRSLPRFATRWVDHPAILRWAGSMAANTDARMLGDLTLAVLRGRHGPQRAQLGELVAGLGQLEADVVNLPNLLFLGVAPELRSSVRSAIVCTLSGEDLFIDGLPEDARRAVIEQIRALVPQVDAFIATSRYYADYCAREYHIPRDRIHAVPMGIRYDEPAEPPPSRDGQQPIVIGHLARICPAKGLLELARAFVALRAAGRNCVLAAGGYLSPADRPYLEEVRTYLRRYQADSHFRYVGELSREQKFEFLRTQDVFSVPAPYPEAKGLYLLEALACGVPVVKPNHGSFTELIAQTGGGLLCEAGNTDSLAEQLDRLIVDPALRRKLGEAGRAAVRERFNDRVMADETWRVYDLARSTRSERRDV